MSSEEFDFSKVMTPEEEVYAEVNARIAIDKERGIAFSPVRGTEAIQETVSQTWPLLLFLKSALAQIRRLKDE